VNAFARSCMHSNSEPWARASSLLLSAHHFASILVSITIVLQKTTADTTHTRDPCMQPAMQSAPPSRKYFHFLVNQNVTVKSHSSLRKRWVFSRFDFAMNPMSAFSLERHASQVTAH